MTHDHVHAPTAQPSHKPRLAKRIHWWRVGAFVLGVLLAISFILALMTEEVTSCTERACQCSRDGSQGQEVPCNTCTTTQKVLVMGAFDLVRSCISREYVTCPANPQACGEGPYCAPVSSEIRPTGECSAHFAPS